MRLSAALLVLAGVLWGTGGLAGALLQSATGIGPVAVAAYRLLVGGGVAVLFTASRLRELRTSAAFRRLLVTGGLLAAFQAAYQVAVAWIGVSLSTLITIGSVPMFVAGVDGLLARRTPGWRTLLAIGGALVGLALLTGGAGPTARMPQGVAMSLLAGAGFALLTLLAARPVAGQQATTSAGLLLGGILLTPFGLLAGGMGLPLDACVLAFVLYLGLVPTAIAYGAYFLGLRHAQPTAAALATMLEPLTATLLAVGLYGERLTPSGIAGALLIVGALALHYL
ncbi:DMT family transporter [Actinophytocola sp.]|uniref:DMT family transporter n=1 Tax=Actinophytocola sp. TaxID=1872138 RepID=UPI002D2AB081|nr:DMT family transporter [Actinophytocola sp.]HYQ63526.1 DMT family transporter [Actinophytocola sp.]